MKKKKKKEIWVTFYFDKSFEKISLDVQMRQNELKEQLCVKIHDVCLALDKN